jgi:molybdopterin molybdotransferase
VEDTDQDFSNGGELPEMIRAFRPLDAGAYVRVQGEDFAAGQALFSKGSVVSPQVLGLIAHLGYQEIQVHRRLRVAVFSSGNELVQPGQPIAEGQIRDTNTFTISALLESMHVEVIPLGIAKDDLEDVQDRLDQALRHNVDLIISTAGVSVGVYDFVRTAVEQHGQIDAWRVNMRPGKPLAFGSYKETPFVGLPGNPVSSFVGFEVFIRPLIQHMAGNQRWRRLELTAVLAEDIHSDGRESYLRARLGRHENGPVATLTGHQGSGNLYSLSLADALIIIPAGVEFLKKGSQVQAWPLT